MFSNTLSIHAPPLLHRSVDSPISFLNFSKKRFERLFDSSDRCCVGHACFSRIEIHKLNYFLIVGYYIFRVAHCCFTVSTQRLALAHGGRGHGRDQADKTAFYWRKFKSLTFLICIFFSRGKMYSDFLCSNS